MLYDEFYTFAVADLSSYYVLLYGERQRKIKKIHAFGN